MITSISKQLLKSIESMKSVESIESSDSIDSVESAELVNELMNQLLKWIITLH